MAPDFSAFVERYQLIYEKDPDSKVFAPLAEAYRRMGLLEEAIDVAERGVRRHPHFASGRVALGKCYAQRSEFAKAVDQLKVAAELSPENLLAHQLIAECYVKLNRTSEALNATKMVLFLNPQDSKAAVTVKKLEEQIFAESNAGWAEEDFSMERLNDVAAKANEIGLAPSAQTQMPPEAGANTSREFEREIALLDARADRGDWEQVQSQLHSLISRYPRHPELLQRKRHFDELTHSQFDLGEWLTPEKQQTVQKKVQKLEEWLSRIENLSRKSRQ